MDKRYVISTVNSSSHSSNGIVAGYTLILAMITFFSGCATFTVSPGGGIPYYLPKPYLLVTKNVTVIQPAVPKSPKPTAAKKKDQKDDCKNININCDSASIPKSPPAPLPKPEPAKIEKKPTYTFQVIYLPDFAEGKKHLKMSAGLGSMTATFALANGWQFGGATVSLDSKTNENITAIGTVASSFAAMAPTSTGESDNGLLSVIEKYITLSANLDTEIASNAYVSEIKQLLLTDDQKKISAKLNEQQKQKKSLEEKLEQLLNQLKNNNEPGIWLFDMKWDESCKCVRFYLIEKFSPFEFEKNLQSSHPHTHGGRCRCGKYH